MSSIPEAVEIGDAVIYQQVNDEAVLLEMGSQAYFGLNDVGARMWQLLVEKGDVDAVVAELKGIYSTDESTLRHDIQALIGALLEAKLLKKRDKV